MIDQPKTCTEPFDSAQDKLRRSIQTCGEPVEPSKIPKWVGDFAQRAGASG